MSEGITNNQNKDTSVESININKISLSISTMDSTSRVKRWCVIDQLAGIFSFYDDENAVKEINFVELSVINSIEEIDTQPLSLAVVTNDGYYIIFLSTSDEMVRWAYALEVATATSKRQLARKNSRSNSLQDSPLKRTGIESNRTSIGGTAGEMIDRIDAINRSIVCSGELKLRLVDEVTKSEVWAYRYAVVASGTVYIYIDFKYNKCYILVDYICV